MNTKPKTFTQWLSDNPDIKQEKCDECDGYGETTCELCGHESVCESCSGKGYSNYVELRQLYENQLKRDLIMLEKLTVGA